MILGALRDGFDGVLISVDLRPAAESTRVTGYNEWRHALTVDVASPPVGGAANRELVAFLARLCGRGATARVVRGGTSRRKTVCVAGVSISAVARAIEKELR